MNDLKMIRLWFYYKGTDAMIAKDITIYNYSSLSHSDIEQIGNSFNNDVLVFTHYTLMFAP